jgi:cysteinyl-tRNA synthetase
MALFKSSEERRIERDIKIRQGIRRIEKAIREQAKFQDEFIRNAQHAKRIGDTSQYQFIRNSLKKTATIRKMLERQLLAVKNALLIKRQAEASADFAGSMGIMATEIGRLFGETDLVKTQADWEKAMVQSQTMEERMDMFLDTIEDIAEHDIELSKAGEVVTDEEIDRLIEAEAEAEHQKELDKLASLRAELDSLKGEGEKQK